MKRYIWPGYYDGISCGTGWAVEVLWYSGSRDPLPQRATTSLRIAVGKHMALQTTSQASRGAATGWLLLCERLQQHYAAVALEWGVGNSRLP